MSEIVVPSKKKYRTQRVAPKHAYRTRTGPRCCNAGCPAKEPTAGTGSIRYSARLRRRYGKA